MADTNLKKSLSLKRGTYAGLQNLINSKAIEDGALYFTTDEGGLYLGIGQEGKDNTLVRMQGSVLYFDELQTFLDTVKPPYSTDVLYFIEKTENADGTKQIFNALMRWDGESWIQINAPMDSFNSLSGKVEELELKLNEVGVPEKDGQEATGLFLTVDKLSELLGVPEIKNGEVVEQIATGLHAAVQKNSEDIAANSELIATNAKDIEDLEKELERLTGENGQIAELEQLIGQNADNIQGIDDLINGDGGLIAQIGDKVSKDEFETLSSNFQDLKDVVGAPDHTDENGEEVEATGIFKKLEERDIRINENEQSIQNITDSINDPNTGILKQISDLDKRATASEEAISSNANDILSNTGRIDILEKAIGIHDDGDPGTESLIDKVESIETLVDEHEEKIAAIEKDIKDNYTTNDQFAEATNALNNKINSHILAANAMRFKGGVDGVTGDVDVTNPLPIESDGVQIGDTYIAIKSFIIDTEIVHAGDLIIANGTEAESEEEGTTGFIKNGTLEWQIVDTGYIQTHENELSIKYSEEKEKNTIQLRSHLGDVLGEIEMNGSSNIDVQLGLDNTINIGMVWDTF